MKLFDLKHKEVINLNDGMRLGYVYDLEFDIERGVLEAILLPGHLSFFRLFFKSEDVVIPVDKISKIGNDFIFVNYEKSDNFNTKPCKNSLFLK